MNKITIYIDANLTPRWNEFPDGSDFVDQADDRSTYDDKGYTEALQKAKEEAICFEDSKAVFALMLDQDKYKWSPEPDSFVTIDYDGTVEVVTAETPCPDREEYAKKGTACLVNHFKKVARLLPSKPKEVSPEVPDRSEKIYPTKPNNVVVQCCPHCNGELIIDIELQQYPESIRTVAGSNTTPYIQIFNEVCHADVNTGLCDSRICCLNPGFLHRGIQNGLKEIQDSINADWDLPDAMRGHINGIIKSMQYSVTQHHERQKAYMQGMREDDTPYPN